MKKSKKPWASVDYFAFFVIVPIIIISIFLLPETIKDSLVLHPSNPTFISVFFSNYVHLEFWNHLLGNLIFYLIVMILIFNIEMDKGRFRKASLLIFIALPFVNSSFVIFFTPFLKNALGFSGIISAFYGYLLFSAYNFIKQNYKPSINGNIFLLLIWGINLFIVDIYNLHDTNIFLQVVMISLVSCIAYNYRSNIKLITNKMKTHYKKLPENQRTYKLILFLITLIFLFSLPIFLIPPVIIMEGGNVTNIMAHWVGYSFGLGSGFIIKR